MIFVIVGGISLGFIVAFSMKKRVDELRQLERIINYIEGELRYKNALLGEALMSASYRCGQPFDSWLRKLSVQLEEGTDLSFYSLWENSLIELEPYSALKKEDIRELFAVGQALGYLDIKSQSTSLSLEKENIHSSITKLDKSLYNNMKVSIILGTLGGIFLVILLL